MARRSKLAIAAVAAALVATMGATSVAATPDAGGVKIAKRDTALLLLTPEPRSAHFSTCFVRGSLARLRWMPDAAAALR